MSTVLNAGAGAPVLVGAEVPAALAEALDAAIARWADPAARAFDYRGFAGSPEYRGLTAAAGSLAPFDCATLGVGTRIAFWLNAYNALVLHAVVERKLSGSVRSQADFFGGSAYQVAGLAFSLDDIEHGLLRINAPRYGGLRRPLPQDDPRLSLAPFMFDERVHFALHAACRSSPRLRAYRPLGFSTALEEATCHYLAGELRVEDGGKALRVPKLFQWYAQDFGGERGVREFVLARLPRDEDLELIERADGDVALRYAEFDWTLNERR